MMYLKQACLIILICLTAACGNGNPSNTEEVSQSSIDSESPSASAIPTLPLTIMQKLVDSVDYVDYIWYNFDFSMSMDNPSGVRYSLAQVGENPANRTSSCQPAGRMFFQIKGRNAAEAEIYFSNGCTYLEFIENNKVVYANSMSPVGIDFLNNQFGAIIKDYQRVE